MTLALIAALVALLTVGGAVWKAYSVGDAHGEAKVTAQYEAAERKAQELEEQARKDEASHTAAVLAAYKEGESKAKTVYVNAGQKGASDVQKFPVFSNPVCVLPAESLANLNVARTAIFGGLRDTGPTSPFVVPTGPDTSRAAGTVPSTGQQGTTGRANSNPVPASNTGHRPLGAVHPPTQ